MMQEKKEVNIGLLGHYGTQNLGDEAIIAAVLQSIRRHCQSVNAIGFSINPLDTSQRHKIPCYPVRRLNSAKKSGATNLNVQDSQSGIGSPRIVKSHTTEILQIRVKTAIKKITPVFKFLKLGYQLIEYAKKIYLECLFLVSNYRLLKKCNLDVLLICGSGQLEDEWGGPWAFPYTIWRWTILARLANSKVAFLSVGAGPINSFLSRLFIKHSVKLSYYRSFRDTASKKLIDAIGVPQPCLVAPDLAHNIKEIVECRSNQGRESNGKLIVGINPMPVYDRRYWHVANNKKYEEYVSQVASFVNSCDENEFEIFFFATQPKDKLVVKDMLQKLDEGRQVELRECNTVNHLMSVINDADIIIATRFHGILLSMHLNKPVLGVCKDSKQFELMKDAGLDEYILDFETFSAEKLANQFGLLLKNRSAVSQRLQIINKQYEEILVRQYDEVLKNN